MAPILQGGKRDSLTSDAAGTPTTPKFTVTSFTEALSLDCNGEAGALAVADTLATLIKILIQKGLINGTIA